MCCGEDSMSLNERTRLVLTDAYKCSSWTNKQLQGLFCGKVWHVLLPLQRASFPSTGQISGQSHVRAEGGVIIHVALLKVATGKASFCSNNGSDLFFFFCKIESKQCFKSLWKWKIQEAGDLRVMLKSHNKVVIQNKHLGCTDSNAALDGCKLIIYFDRPVLELMTHLFKPFTCFCWAVKRRKELYSFHGLIEKPH